ncbi:MAG: zinc-binding dehydrogenase [Sphaerochaetaceae bacterium]
MEQINRLGRVVSPGVVDYIERSVVALSATQVRIAVKASAICGSDLHIFKGMHPFCKLPATVGHEFSGIVTEVGSRVSRWKLGDRVTVEPCITCGVCDECRSGRYSYCEHITFLYRNGDGAMADHVVAESDHVFALPDDLSFEAGALIEPLAVATHAVRQAEIALGQSVVIIGAGAIGVLVAAMCRRSGVSRIAVVDTVDNRLDLARAFGASHTINAMHDDVEQKIREFGGAGGVDRTFECVGRQETFVQAMMWLRKGGLATMVGIFEQPEISIPVTRFVSHEIRVQGAQGYCWDFPIALDVAKELDLERLVTHTFPMDRLQEAFDTALDRSKAPMKILLVPGTKVDN